MAFATLCLVGKIPITTPPRFLPAPWAEHSHREPELLSVAVRCELDGRTVTGDIAVWRYASSLQPARSERMLMVHGFRGDHHGMQLIVDGLPEFEVLVPDLPGFGRSAPLRTQDGTRVEHTVDLYSAVVDAVAEVFTFGPGDSLVGHSFGTIVCAAHCAVYTRQWSSVVLSAPISDNIFRGRRLPGACLVELYYRVAQLLPESAGNALLRSPTVLRVMNLTLGVGWDQDLQAFVEDQHRQFFGRYTDRATLLDSYWASSRHTALDFAEAVTIPTLLVPGTQDNLSTPRGRRALRDALPHGELEVIRGAGHLVHYEKPAQLSRAIRRFVRVMASSCS